MSEWNPDGQAGRRPVWTPRVSGSDPADDAGEPRLTSSSGTGVPSPAVPGRPAGAGDGAWRPGTAPSQAGSPPAQAFPAHDEAGPAVPPSRRDRGAAGRRRPPARTGPLSWLRETAIVLVSALVLSLLVKTFLVQAFWIPSPSMNDTLIQDDRILVSKLAPGPFSLHRGDIVVFKDPGGWLADQPVIPVSGPQRVLNDVLTFVGLRPVDAGQHLVKRIIGLPGDHIVCTGPTAHVTVNGVALDEPYLAPGSQPCGMAFDTTVPAGSLWVMGDNRDHSEDSRYHQGNPGGGSIPEANVVGTAFVIVWPVDRWTVLHNPGATFAHVPNPS